MRPLWIGLGGLAFVLLVLAQFRGPIAVRVMERAIERNMTRDFVAELPDGLHVILCGAGGPLPDPERSGPCVAVIAGTSVFVVDVGAGTPRNLGVMGVQAGATRAVFLSHFHSDHIDGLGEFAMLRWVGAANRTPLPVFGPPGVDQIVAGYNRAYRLDQGYRTAHHGDAVAPASGAGMTAEAFSKPEPGREVTVWNEAGVTVEAFAVEHLPVDPAVGYRFRYGGRSLVITGDTKRSEEVLRMATGTDLLVHEALSPELMGIVQKAAENAGNASIAKISKDVLDYHATPVQAAEIAQEAGVGHLLFYHVVPAQPLPGLSSIFLDGVSDAYGGDVTLGIDGSMVSLPKGSESILTSQR